MCDNKKWFNAIKSELESIIKDANYKKVVVLTSFSSWAPATREEFIKLVERNKANASFPIPISDQNVFLDWNRAENPVMIKQGENYWNDLCRRLKNCK